MENYRHNLSKMLRSVRQSCGLSQAAVAKGLCVHRATYSYYEEGKRTPSIEILIILAKIFDIPAEAFLCPEKFQSVQAIRIQPPKTGDCKAERLGGLTPEETELILQLRRSKSK